MSIPKMSIPTMSTVPKMSIPIMSTVPKCLFLKCLLFKKKKMKEKKDNKYSIILKSKEQQNTGNGFNIYLYNFTKLTVTEINRRKLLMVS